MSYIVILMSFQTIYSINYDSIERKKWLLCAHVRIGPDRNITSMLADPISVVNNIASASKL